MKKTSILLLFMSLMLAGCSAGTDTLSIDEKNVPPGAVNTNQGDVLQRIEDIKNGATPKVKPTGKETESAATSEQQQQSQQQTQQQSQQQQQQTTQPVSEAPKTATNNLQINEKTKNMNVATIKTSKGVIKVKLNVEKAPISVENFKRYAENKSYSGTIFHRVMPNFMIQGGGFDEKGTQRPTEAPIRNEADNGLKNMRGTIAMARTNVVDSATSQFFINLVDNDFLNYRSPDAQGYGYAVFGEVTEGMDVVDAIAKVQTTTKDGGYENWPVDNVVIEGVTLSE